MALYVYYKVPVMHAAALATAVADMQSALGVPATLARRPEASDGLHTWMETYPKSGFAFSARLAQAADAAGLERWISGARHVEYFEEQSACA